MSDSRHPAGTSIGGQWAPSAAGEVDDMLDETFDPPVAKSRTEFRDSGVDVGRVEPGEVVRIDGGRAYVLGGSRGIVAPRRPATATRCASTSMPNRRPLTTTRTPTSTCLNPPGPRA